MPVPTTYTYTALELLTAAKMNNDNNMLQTALNAVWEPVIIIIPLNTQTALSAGNNIRQFHISPRFNGWTISRVTASRDSGTGLVSIQIYNINKAANVLSTPLTIDDGETSSSTAATPAVINTSYDDVASYERLRIDVSSAGTNTLYAVVNIELTRP